MSPLLIALVLATGDDLRFGAVALPSCMSVLRSSVQGW